MGATSTVLDLRQGNRARALRRLLLDGETTRARLAEDCQLSQSTVTNVVRDLIDEGLVEERGSVPSNGGRPIARLAPRADGALLLGADVGEQGVTVEAFDLTLQRRDEEHQPVRSSAAGPRAIAEALEAAINRLVERLPDLGLGVVGLGLGVPGVVETGDDGQPVLYAQHLHWNPIPIRSLVAGDLAVFADNGAKTLAAAEAWLGAARGVAHSVVVLVGHGIGAAVVSDGRILRGVSGSAGEWGHTKIALNGPMCACGAKGCLEAVVGGGALARRWRQTQGAGPGDRETADVDDLLQSAAAGDASAIDVLDDAIDVLGAGLANLVNLLNPEQLVVGGWAGIRLIRARREQLVDTIRRNSLDRPARRVRLEPAQLGDDAVALGAALLPLEQLIEGTLPHRKVSP